MGSLDITFGPIPTATDATSISDLTADCPRDASQKVRSAVLTAIALSVYRETEEVGLRTEIAHGKGPTADKESWAIAGTTELPRILVGA